MNATRSKGVDSLWLWGMLCCATPTFAADLWVDAHAVTQGDGSRTQPFKTIQAAATTAMPGDTVRVLPGVYRERVMPTRGGLPGQPIVYRSEVLHGATVKGSDVWSPAWRSEGEGLFSARLDEALFTDNGYVDGGNPYRIAYDWDKPRNNLPPFPYKEVQWTLGQMFVDGAPLPEKSSRAQLQETPPSWWFDARANRILLNLGGDSPTNHTIELTTRRGVFRPKLKGLGYIELHGFVFEHCANQFPAQFWALERNAPSGMVGTRAGHHWVISSNIIRHAKSVGLTFGNIGQSGSSDPFDNESAAESCASPQAVGFHRIEGNWFDQNGAIGAMGRAHEGVVFCGNIFSRNNSLGNNAYEIGGIKTHHAFNLLVEGNWFIDNDCMGIWLDNTWRNCRVTRNVFLGNRGKNIFFEMDDNTPATASTVDCNLFLPGRPTLVPQTGSTTNTPPLTGPWSVGIYGHDADGVCITHNLFAGEGYGLYFRKITNRKGGAANIVATGNLFAGGALTAACLPAPNPPFAQGNEFDWNIYPAANSPATAATPFVATGWSQNDGKTDDTIVGQLQSKLGGGPAPLSPFGKTNHRPPGYYLSLDQWRGVMGFDSNSVVAPLRCEFDRASWTLTVVVPTNALRPMPPHDKTATDFFGKPFEPNAVAGPFANLKPGRQVIHIPAPSEYPAPHPTLPRR